MKQVLSDVSSGSLMQEVYSAQGDTLDKLIADNQDAFNQLFVETATWGLKHWEEFCGIGTDLNKPLEIRRAAIRTHLLGTGTVTKDAIKRVSADFGFNQVDIFEDYAPYIVKLIFDNTGEAHKGNATEVLRALRELLPAHVDMFYIFLRNSWKEVQDALMIFNDLDGYQWRDFSEANDVSATQSPNLGMNIWADGDLISMGGFNTNFRKIDDKFGANSGHVHNGIDGHRIDAGQETKYTVTEMGNTNMADAINRLNNKIGISGGKDQLKSITGGNALNENTWSLIVFWLQKSKEAIVGAITAKGVPASTSDNFSVLNNKINQIDIGIPPQGTAEENEVRAGKTFINSTGVKTGTATVHAANTVFMPKVTDTILNGIHDGTTKVKGDSALTGGNIKQGVKIFGVTGHYSDSLYHEGDVIPVERVNIHSESNDVSAWAYFAVSANNLREIEADPNSSAVFVGGNGLLKLNRHGDFLWARLPYNAFGQALTITDMIIVNNEVYAACYDAVGSYLCKLNPITGDVVWKYTSQSTHAARGHLAYTNNRLYYNNGGETTFIEVVSMDGIFIKRIDTPQMVTALCATKAGFVYYATKNMTGPWTTLVSGNQSFRCFRVNGIEYFTLASVPWEARLHKIDPNNGDAEVWNKDISAAIPIEFYATFDKRHIDRMVGVDEDNIIFSSQRYTEVRTVQAWGGSGYVNVNVVDKHNDITKLNGETQEYVHDENYTLWYRMHFAGESRELAISRFGTYTYNTITWLQVNPNNTIWTISGSSNAYRFDANVNFSNGFNYSSSVSSINGISQDNLGDSYWINDYIIRKNGKRITYYRINP